MVVRPYCVRFLPSPCLWLSIRHVGSPTAFKCLCFQQDMRRNVDTKVCKKRKQWWSVTVPVERSSEHNLWKCALNVFVETWREGGDGAGGSHFLLSPGFQSSLPAPNSWRESYNGFLSCYVIYAQILSIMKTEIHWAMSTIFEDWAFRGEFWETGFINRAPCSTKK